MITNELAETNLLNNERENKMNLKKLLGLGLVCGLLQCSTALAAEAVTIVDTGNNKLVNTEQMAEALVGYDAVFFGEYHDQPVLHEVELELLQALYTKHGDRLVLSMEMFEADNQDILDDYLAGKVSEDNFLANSRPWPNYQSDYRGLIEFAKEHKIPVIAANIPRFMAKEGTIANIGWDYKKYLPKYTTAPEGAYRDKFFGYMS